jgi:hypothetical protein
MTTLTRADWEQRAKDLKIEGRAYINGEYTAAVSGDTFECLSPVDGRLLTTVASCDVATPSAPWKTPAPPSTPVPGHAWPRPSAKPP